MIPRYHYDADGEEFYQTDVGEWVRHEDVVKLLEGLKRGDCWCEHGIGNPMVNDHTDACKLAAWLMKGSAV